MKTHFLIAIIGILCSSLTFSQNELWPTENAEWFYYFPFNMGMGEGYRNYQIDRDTLIQGKACQVYSITGQGNSYNYEDQPTGIFDFYKEEIIVGMEDNVLYHFINNNETFDTIINFNAVPGNYWYDFQGWKTTVTNVGTENVGGKELLKFTLLKEFDDLGFNGTETISFYQLFGDPLGSFIYNRPWAGLDADVDQKLRCFNYHIGETDEFTPQFSAVDCDFVPSLGVTAEDVYHLSIKNPVENNEITISHSKELNINDIQLYNALGERIAVKVRTENNQIIGEITKNLNNGIYSCVLILGSGDILTRKLVVE